MSQSVLDILCADIESIFPETDNIKVSATRNEKDGYSYYQIFLNTLLTYQSKDCTAAMNCFRTMAEDYLREHEYIIENPPYTSSNIPNSPIEIVIRAKKKIESEG